MTSRVGRTRRVHIRLLALVLGALALCAPATASAKLTPATAADRLGGTEAQLRADTSLTRTQLAQVIKGARKYGGLSDTTTLKVLQDRKLIRGVPVSESTSSSPIASAARAYPRKGCRRSGAQVSMKNVVGIRLWTYKLSKFWCWNKRRKRVEVKRGSIEDAVDIPQAAAIAGWRDRKERESSFYYRYRGSGKRGAHSTYMRTRFDYCPVRIGCSNSRRAAIRLGVRWTGSAWESHGVS